MIKIAHFQVFFIGGVCYTPTWSRCRKNTSGLIGLKENLQHTVIHSGAFLVGLTQTEHLSLLIFSYLQPAPLYICIILKNASPIRPIVLVISALLADSFFSFPFFFLFGYKPQMQYADKKIHQAWINMAQTLPGCHLNSICLSIFNINLIH